MFLVPNSVRSFCPIFKKPIQSPLLTKGENFTEEIKRTDLPEPQKDAAPGVPCFNREIRHDLSNLGGPGGAGNVNLTTPRKIHVCYKVKHQMLCATLGLDYPRRPVSEGPSVAGALEPNSSLSYGHGWLQRDVTLVNYDNWAIRITEDNINLEGLCMCQLCESQMYAFIKCLLASEIEEASHAASLY